ncbi:hypothetical protein ACFYP8_39560, partial [Streptomyces hirsutus]
MAGSLAYGRLGRHRRPERLLILNGTAATVAAAVLLIVQTTTGSTLLLTWLCLLITISAFGLFFPAVITIAQSRGPVAPGATSALLGSGQFLLGAAASPLVGLFGTQSPAPMAAVMTTCLALGTLAAIATQRTEPSAPGPLPRKRVFRPVVSSRIAGLFMVHVPRHVGVDSAVS